MIDTPSPYHHQDDYNGSSHHHDAIIDDHHDGSYANTSSAYGGIKPKKELPEIELWLCSKLNTDWSSDRIASQINEETLELFLSDANHHNYENFYNLGVSNSPLIKLRFIMCCLSVKKKQMSPTLASHFCTLFKNIIENTHGEDDWVRMMAEILYLFPEHSCIRTDIQTSILNELGISAPLEQEDSPQRYFQQAIKHFRNLSLKDEDGDTNMGDDSKNSQSPFATLKPNVFKYLNVSTEGNEELSKEFNEKKHYLEEMAIGRSLYSSQSCSLVSNKHFNLRPSACKNLIEPLSVLDELESESAKKNVGVKLSPLKKLTPTRPQPYNSNTHTPTSANMLNKNKLTGIKKINNNLPSTPKTTLIKNPPIHGTQLISTPISAATPRSVFLDDSVALQRMKEQQLNEKKRTSTKQLTDEQKNQEKERKRIEKIESKEKKEKEKLEKKKAKEEAKKKQAEERKVAAQQAQLANGAGPGRKRRKNNPANAQQGMPQGDNMIPQAQDPNINQPMHGNPTNPHQQALFSTTLMNHTAPYLSPMFNPGTPGGFSHFPQTQYSNMSGLLANPFFANQQNPSQPTNQQPGLMAPPGVLSGNLGKGNPQEQQSFTQLLGINSSQPSNARPPANNLLPSIGTTSFPTMMGFHQQPDNNAINGLNNQMMMMGRPQATPNQMRQPQYPPNYQQFENTQVQQQQQPTQQPQQPQANDEERRQRVEHYLNTNILKDCNRVTEETRTKIFQFLTGRVPEDGPLEDKVLIHEEYGNEEKRQIFFHMDHTNRKWKKIMQKQSNQPTLGLE